MAKLMKINEALKELKISRTTLYHMIKAGEIPAIPFRGCIRIDERDIDEYIAQFRHRD
jgi:excisionase family DNA binding protein